jgi:magnesium-transporting ATPase (P-type)
MAPCIADGTVQTFGQRLLSDMLDSNGKFSNNIFYRTVPINVISIYQFIGTYAPQYFASPLNPLTTVFTLMLVMLVTSFKEGFEDLQRYRCDFEDNNRPVTVVTFDETTEEPIETIKKSQDIRVGDIVKLTGRMMIPADMLVILTSNYLDANQCFVETTNIDGETNLKVREAPVAFNQLIKDDKNPMKKSLFTGFTEYELPNKNIHTFIGAFHSEALVDPIPLVSIFLCSCILFS